MGWLDAHCKQGAGPRQSASSSLSRDCRYNAMTKSSLRVSVSFTANAALYVPRPPQGAVIVGVVIRGIEIGALARCADGSFVKVNGDVVTRLNPRHVQAALDRARPRKPRESLAPVMQSAAPAANSPPVVVIKKRRRIAAAV